MRENLSLWFPTRSDRNRAVQPQKTARRMKFRIRRLYYISSKNKGADQLRSTVQLICPFDLAYAKNRFSHDATQITYYVLKRSNKIIS